MGAQISDIHGYDVQNNDEKTNEYTVDNSEEDMEEVSVTGGDKRLKIFQTQCKDHAIIQCIGQLRITYNGVRTYTIGTGTIFHVEQNKCFVLTCAHNIFAHLYVCTNDKCKRKYLRNESCKDCQNSVQKSKKLSEATRVEFVRRDITKANFGDYIIGYDCKLSESFIKSKEYSAYPHIKSGNDIAILVINNTEAVNYYKDKCSDIFLVHNFELFSNEQQMCLFGYPGDKKNGNDSYELWGMSTPLRNTMTYGCNFTNFQLYLVNEEIDTHSGQSGSSIYCKGENENSFWICSVHTGGSSSAMQNYATLLDRRTLKWIQDCFHNIDIDINHKIIEKSTKQSIMFEQIKGKISMLEEENLEHKNDVTKLRNELEDQRIQCNKYSLELSEKQLQIEALYVENEKLKRENNQLLISKEIENDEKNDGMCTWDANKKGNDISIDGNSVKHNGWFNGWSSVYGKMKCKEAGRYSWKLYVEYIEHNTIVIGVASNDTNYLNEAADGPNAYVFYSRSTNTHIKNDGCYDTGLKGYAQKIEKSDKIEIVLNLGNNQKDNTLSFKINERDYGISCSVPKDKEYQLVISMYHKGTKVILWP
eukprot:8089_1